MRFVQTAVLLLAACALTAPLGAQEPPVLRKSPEFVIKTPDGNQTLLSSYRGKVIALLFVHTTCPHCQHAVEVFSKFQAEFGARGFQPLAVAFNPMANMFVKDFVKEHHVTFPVGFSPPEDVLNYMNISLMARYFVPQVAWIDRRGNIRSQTAAQPDDKLLQEPYWRNMIETLLKEPASTKTGAPAHRPTSAQK